MFLLFNYIELYRKMNISYLKGAINSVAIRELNTLIIKT